MKKKKTKIVAILMLSVLSIACLIIGCACGNNTSITLNKNSVVFDVCQQEQIIANVSGTSEKVSWSTSDKSIATVDENGTITAKKLGLATITASVNGKSATCDVDVRCETSILSLNYNSHEQWTILLRNENDNVTVTSSDDQLVTVEKLSQKGTKAYFDINCKKSGDAVFSIALGDKTISENVSIKPVITLNVANRKLRTNDSISLVKDTDYSVEGSTENVVFSSGDTSVATIDANGQITTKAQGQTAITLSLHGAVRSFNINVFNGHTEYAQNVTTASMLNDTIKGYTTLTNSQKEFEYLRDNPNTVSNGQKSVSLDLKSMLMSGTYLVSLKLKNTDGLTFTQILDKAPITDKLVLNEEYQNYLFPNSEYYFDIYDINSPSYLIDCGILKTDDDTVRYIKIDGVQNVRDIGGWTTADGSTVKYGLVYRGGRLNSDQQPLSESAKYTMNDLLGLNTEIDLRTSGFDDLGQNVNWFDSTKLYVKASITQYDRCLSNSGYNQYIKLIFQTFANKNNYPIYFHCSWGADRTGTVAFLLNGLLGVSYEDLTRDFEITSFTQGKRWRSAANSTNTDWSSTGVMQDDSDNYVAWGKLYNYVMTNYAGDTLQDKIATYLKGVGITDAQIQSIKDIMLEKPVTTVQTNNVFVSYLIKNDKSLNFIATDVVSGCIFSI